MLLPKLQQVDQNLIHPGPKSLIQELLIDLNLELLIVVVEVNNREGTRNQLQMALQHGHG